MRRPGNNPKRRVAPEDRLSQAERSELALRVQYVPSGHHKRFPANYGLQRVSPRPTKSLCDMLRIIPLEEAKAMIQRGIMCGMFSDFFLDGHPKFVWCVGDDGEVYEAKTDLMTLGVYHGYRLEEEDNVREYIVQTWKDRCPKLGR